MLISFVDKAVFFSVGSVHESVAKLFQDNFARFLEVFFGPRHEVFRTYDVNFPPFHILIFKYSLLSVQLCFLPGSHVHLCSCAVNGVSIEILKVDLCFNVSSLANFL